MKQLGLFEEEIPEVKINKKIRLIELFAGFGSQAMAFERIAETFGMKDLFEAHFVCEFDKYANSLYNAAHDSNFPISDVTKINAKDLNIINTDIYSYLLFYSFPCTDLSVAGKQAGMSRESGTRSSLLWEVERLLKECKELSDKDKTFGLPQVLIMENVPQVIAEKNMPDFKTWIDFLNQLGYSSFYKILNSKDFGIPQNRERCFMVSILGKYDFEFPEEIPLHYVMADVLDEEVEEKFFIKNEKAEKLIQQLIVEKKIPEIENE